MVRLDLRDVAVASRKEREMHVVIRSYSRQGASELFDLLGQQEHDVKALITGVPGFVSYAAFRSKWSR
jgi:hypothetical protein